MTKIVPELPFDGNPPAIAFVIPAHDEEQTIGEVVAACAEAAASLGASVTVVADHCTDSTEEVALAHGARVLVRCGNRPSKYESMLLGVQETCSELLFFVDADCRDLTAEHLERIALPVIRNEALMSVGTFDYGRPLNFFVRRVPWSSGQRVLPRSCFPRDDRRALGYNVELLVNEAIGEKGGTTSSVLMEGVTQRTKRDKRGTLRGITATMGMWRQISGSSRSIDPGSYRRYCQRIHLYEMDGRVRRRRASVLLGFYGMLSVGLVLGR